MNAQIHSFIHSLFQKPLKYLQSFKENLAWSEMILFSSLVTTIGHTFLSLYEALELVQMKIIMETGKWL